MPKLITCNSPTSQRRSPISDHEPRSLEAWRRRPGRPAPGSDGEDLIRAKGPPRAVAWRRAAEQAKALGMPGRPAGRAQAGFSGVGPSIDRHPATIALRVHQGHQPKRPPGVSRGPLFEAGEGPRGRGLSTVPGRPHRPGGGNGPQGRRGRSSSQGLSVTP